MALFILEKQIQLQYITYNCWIQAFDTPFFQYKLIILSLFVSVHDIGCQ